MKKLEVNEIEKIRNKEIKIPKEDRTNFILDLYNISFETKKINIYDFQEIYIKYKKKLKTKSIYETFLSLYDDNLILFMPKTRFDGSSYMSEDLKIYMDKFFDGEIPVELNVNANEISKSLLKEIKKLNEETLKMNENIKNYNKEILTIMALFVSVVALLTSNITAIGNLTQIGIITMNLSLILAIVVIFFLINNIVGKKGSKMTNNIFLIIFIIIFLIALTIITIFCNESKEKNNNENIITAYTQSVQFDIKGDNN